MITLRCKACNSELLDEEIFLDQNIKDYNDLCYRCLESIEDIRRINDNSESTEGSQDDPIL
jgi:hypothetical protein